MVLCPHCGYKGTPVYETRGNIRSRKCLSCLKRFKTIESATILEECENPSVSKASASLKAEVSKLIQALNKTKRELKTLRQKVSRERTGLKPRRKRVKCRSVPVPMSWADSLMHIPESPLDHPKPHKDETGWDNLDDVEYQVHAVN